MRSLALLLPLAAVLAACGGKTTSSTAPQKKILVAALGDSITAGSPGFNPSHAMAKLLGQGEVPKSQWEYWAQQKDPGSSSGTAVSTVSGRTRSRSGCAPAGAAPPCSSCRAGSTTSHRADR